MQTAVEYFAEKEKYFLWLWLRDEISAAKADILRADAFRKALEMETQQILNAHEAGSYTTNETTDEAKANAGKYWQSTYGTNEPICGCGNCTEHYQHKSDCAVHNMPAMPNGQCDCNSTVPKQNQ